MVIGLRDVLEVVAENHGVSVVVFHSLISFEICFGFLLPCAQLLSVHTASVKPQEGYMEKKWV